MKILYLNAIETNSPWGAECFVNKALLSLGHETITIDYRKNRRSLDRAFRDLLEDIDVLFLQRGEYFPLELIRAVNRPRIFWASELVSRCRDQDRIFKSGLFSHAFVRTPTCRETIVGKGWLDYGQVSILLSGFDPDSQFLETDIQKDIDVLFVGNVLPRRQIWLSYLSQYFNVVTERAFGLEMTRLVNRAKIVLNIHAEEHLDTETRVFEVLGAGAFLISERLSEENPFENGEDYIEVDSMEQMQRAINKYLADASARNRIAARGHSTASSRHSYLKRAEFITEIFKSYIDTSTDVAVDERIVSSFGRRKVIYILRYKASVLLLKLRRYTKKAAQKFSRAVSPALKSMLLIGKR